MGLGADPDDDDENPDVWQLFRHYDALYFRGVLIEAGFSVEWSHPRTKTTRFVGLNGFLLLPLLNCPAPPVLRRCDVATPSPSLAAAPPFVARSNADVLDNISSKNAHKQGDLATPLKKQKLEHDLVDQHGGTKPLGGSTGNKVGKLHKPEGIQKTSVLPAAPPRRLKQDLVASEKKDFSSFVGRSNANVLDNISSKKPHKQREHEDTWKPIARPPAPQSILKQQSKTNSSTKAGKQQIPECFQKTFIQPAASQSKPKRSNHVAPGRPKTRSKTSNPARKKEYACVSVWANIYESECSSGSAEPLVNKRTERRKRARERSVQIRRSRKRSASGISPIKAQPAAAEDEISSQQGKPPPQSQCLQFILIDSAVTQDPRDQSQPQAPSMGIAVPPADKVKTQTPRGHSQLPAQCMDIDIPPADLVTTQTHGGPSIRSTCIGIATVPPADHVMTRAPVHQSRPPAPCSITTDLVVPPHSADPPSLTPLNPSSSPDVIDISDDD
uniref:Uncharacterized protein n=1 Tax=Avena sativa TaxID=4498 RepID=A0ACD5XL50_AVESA